MQVDSGMPTLHFHFFFVAWWCFTIAAFFFRYTTRVLLGKIREYYWQIDCIIYFRHFLAFKEYFIYWRKWNQFFLNVTKFKHFISKCSFSPFWIEFFLFFFCSNKMHFFIFIDNGIVKKWRIFFMIRNLRMMLQEV